MVSKTPPAEMMRPADYEQLIKQQQEALETVEEDADSQVNSFGIQGPQYRYTEEEIYGIGKVRFRSLTAREFIEIQNASDETLLLHCVVTPEGKQKFTPESLAVHMEQWDAETYLDMVKAADRHCFRKKSTEAMVEEQAGN